MSITRYARRFTVFPAAIVACLLVVTPTLAADTNTRRVSISSAEAQATGKSSSPSISTDGRFVAFESDATDLIPNDTNGATDVFVRDRQLGTTRRVSISSAEVQATDSSFAPSISADGRYVAFESGAGNLVANDTNGFSDIFVRDLQSGTTRRVSISSTEAQGNNFAFEPSTSVDGRYVAFQSFADDLVANDTNDQADIFVRDTQLGTTQRVNLTSAEAQAMCECNTGGSQPSISADGRFVAFSSLANNLVANDTNGTSDVFVRDRQLGTTRRVSISSAEVQATDASGSSISADGRYVAFESTADDLTPNDTNGAKDIFVRDRQLGTTRRVSISSAEVQATDSSFAPSISADGRYVAFESDAGNLVANDTNGRSDIFVRDLQLGTTRRTSVDSFGAQAMGSSSMASISSDGSYVAFQSRASDLIANDTNATLDVFVRGPLH